MALEAVGSNPTIHPINLKLDPVIPALPRTGLERFALLFWTVAKR